MRRAVLSLALVLLVVGCGRVRRVHDCQRVAGVVNAALKEILPLTKKEHDVAALRSIADRYDALSKQLASEKPANHDVAGTVSELGKLFKEAGKETRALSDATDRKQRADIFVAEHRLDELAHRERSEAYRLNGLCHRP